MKKVLVLLSFSALVYACGGSGGSAKKEDSTATTKPATTQQSAGDDEKALEMIGALDCTTCHKINEKLIGPAYTEVAKKYEATDAVVDDLANKVIKGSQGVWGTVPMTPHPDLSMDSARVMVKYILTLKNKQ